MRHLIVTLQRLLIGATIAVLPIVAPAAAKPASAASRCAFSDVTIVVDFSHFGQGIRVGCASSPSSGWDALVRANFAPQPVPKYGTNFVCQISGLPQNTNCATTPPATAYWAYWEASSPSASWTYSSFGAGVTHPAPGSVEGWAFGSRAAPAVSPSQAAAAPAPPPPPPPPPPPSPTTGARPPVGATGSRETSAGGGAAGAENGSQPGPAASNSSVGNTGGPATASTSGRGSAIVNGAGVLDGSTDGGATRIEGSAAPENGSKSSAAQPGSATDSTGTNAAASNGSRIVNQASSPIRIHEHSGSPWPLVVTLAILTALTAAAVLIARARRRAAT